MWWVFISGPSTSAVAWLRLFRFSFSLFWRWRLVDQRFLSVHHWLCAARCVLLNRRFFQCSTCFSVQHTTHTNARPRPRTEPHVTRRRTHAHTRTHAQAAASVKTYCEWEETSTGPPYPPDSFVPDRLNALWAQYASAATPLGCFHDRFASLAAAAAAAAWAAAAGSGGPGPPDGGLEDCALLAASLGFDSFCLQLVRSSLFLFCVSVFMYV